MQRFFGPALIATTFIALAIWTWGTWPDVVIDFGRELYVPWRITRGELLYRDIAYFNGAFSPYFNALIFGLFSASVRTLFIANLTLLALFTLLVYRLLVAIGDRFSAFLSTLVFLCVFAFGQLVGFGNYNFIAPYSHEATHGLMLATVALAALMRWRATGAAIPLVLGGVCVGLALLTKPEMGAAALVASVVCLIRLYDDRDPSLRPRRVLPIFAVAVVLPSIVGITLFSLAMPFTEACRGIASPWIHVGSVETISLPFYRQGLGLDRPAENAIAMVTWAGLWGIAFAPALLLASTLKMSHRAARLMSVLIFTAYASALIVWRQHIPWDRAAKPLPIWCVLILGLSVAKLLRGSESDSLPLTASFAVLSSVLLAKVVLNVRVSHYGFVLAAPAMMLAITALASWIPEALDRRAGQGLFVRAASLALATAFCVAHLERTAFFIARKNITVGYGADAFRSDVRGRFINRALMDLAKTPPDSTFAVLPEGVMLNFLARRRNPTRFMNFMPPEVLLFGEQTMLQSFEAHPPDRIVLVHKDTS